MFSLHAPCSLKRPRVYIQFWHAGKTPSWRGLSSPYMVKYDNSTLPANLWSTGVEECLSGDVGMFHQREGYKPLLTGKGRMRPNGTERILAEGCFFFKLWRINTFVPLSALNKSWSQKNMQSPTPHVSEKKKSKARLKTCSLSLMQFSLLAWPLFPRYTCTHMHAHTRMHAHTHIHTHTHWAYTQPMKHLRRKDNFLWNITQK